MLLNCESQFSTYHVITNKATAVSCTTITRPPQSSAGVGESPEMLKNLMPTWIICLHFLGVWNWWKRSYVSHTIVGWLVTAAVNEHRAQLRCAYNQTMWFRGCQPSDLSPSAASSASHCSPGKKSCWCGRSRRPRSRSGGPFGALSSGRPPSCCRSATHKGRWEPRRGWGWGPATSLMPGQEPLGTGATVLRSNVCAQATWKMFWVFFFLPLVSIILSFSEAQPGYVHWVTGRGMDVVWRLDWKYNSHFTRLCPAVSRCHSHPLPSNCLMALATVLALYLQQHSAMNGSQNRCDFSSVGPHLFFNNLPCICHCPEVQHELPARQEEDATQSCHPRYVWEKVSVWKGRREAKCAGHPLPWHGGGLVLLHVICLSCLCSGTLILLLPSPCACSEPGPAHGAGTHETQG